MSGCREKRAVCSRVRTGQDGNPGKNLHWIKVVLQAEEISSRIRDFPLRKTGHVNKRSQRGWCGWTDLSLCSPCSVTGHGNKRSQHGWCGWAEPLTLLSLSGCRVPLGVVCSSLCRSISLFLWFFVCVCVRVCVKVSVIVC